jgi:hypothetical protein
MHKLFYKPGHYIETDADSTSIDLVLGTEGIDTKSINEVDPGYGVSEHVELQPQQALELATYLIKAAAKTMSLREQSLINRTMKCEGELTIVHDGTGRALDVKFVPGVDKR